MRVLLLSQFYPPVSGGVEVHVAALAEGLAERGHHVAVATLDGGGNGGAPSVQVHQIRSTSGRFGILFTAERHHAPPVPDPEVVLGLRALEREFAPDIVHAHNWMGRSFLPLARRSHARFVVTLHDCGAVCAQCRRMFRGEEYCERDGALRCLGCASAFFGPVRGAITLAGNRAVRSAEVSATDLYLPVSRAVARANRLDEAGARYEVVPNFVAEHAADALPASRVLAMLPPIPFILQVGDVVADKGVHVLFEAYRRLESPPPLVLIGRISDEMRDALPRGALATGVWPHELVSEAWHRSMFGTMPSLCLDACPTVTIEAMAAGKPVIASARGGLVDQVVNGTTGLLVTPGDPRALAIAMESLASNAATRERMGAAARERFETTFRADVVIDRIEQQYAALLG